MRNLFYFCFSFLIINCQSQSETVNNKPTKTVSEFCQSFVIKYAETHSYIYQQQSVKIQRKNFLERQLNKLSDIVSPKGSSFTDGYDCLFQVEDTAGDFYNISVGLFLAETYDFAKYTITDNSGGKIQTGSLVPIEYIISQSTKKQGYGVFKFLRKTKSL